MTAKKQMFVATMMLMAAGLTVPTAHAADPFGAQPTYGAFKYKGNEVPVSGSPAGPDSGAAANPLQGMPLVIPKSDGHIVLADDPTVPRRKDATGPLPGGTVSAMPARRTIAEGEHLDFKQVTYNPVKPPDAPGEITEIQACVFFDDVMRLLGPSNWASLYSTVWYFTDPALQGKNNAIVAGPQTQIKDMLIFSSISEQPQHFLYSLADHKFFEYDPDQMALNEIAVRANQSDLVTRGFTPAYAHEVYNSKFQEGQVLHISGLDQYVANAERRLGEGHTGVYTTSGCPEDGWRVERLGYQVGRMQQMKEDVAATAHKWGKNISDVWQSILNAHDDALLQDIEMYQYMYNTGK